MKKSFKLFLAAAFLVTEFFVIALPMLTTSARADGAIQAITHAGFGGGTDVTTRMMLLRARRVLKQDMQLVNKKGCLLYTSPSPRDRTRSRMPSSA